MANPILSIRSMKSVFWIFHSRRRSFSLKAENSLSDFSYRALLLLSRDGMLTERTVADGQEHGRRNQLIVYTRGLWEERVINP